MRFVFDLDGTLVFGDNHIGPELTDQLKQLESLGHEVLFASARSYRDCYPILKDSFSDNTLIALNGATIIKKGMVDSSTAIPEEASHQLKRLCQAMGLSVFMDDALNHAYQKEEHISFIDFVAPEIGERVTFEAIGPLLKVVIFTNHDKELQYTIDKELQRITGISYFLHRGESAFYITAEGVTKATAIRQLQLSPFICFGNDQNDIEMFQEAMHAVQVGDYGSLSVYADESIKLDDNLIDNLCQCIDRLAKTAKEG